MVLVPEFRYPVTLFAELLALALQRAGYPRIRVTSWLRTQVLDEGAGPRSLHLRGLAMDLIGDVVGFGSAWTNLGLDAVYEADHLHVELDGPALRRIGVDFRT